MALLTRISGAPKTSPAFAARAATLSSDDTSVWTARPGHESLGSQAVLSRELGDDHRGSQPGQGQADLPADAAAASGHDRRPASQGIVPEAQLFQPFSDADRFDQPFRPGPRGRSETDRPPWSPPGPRPGPRPV